MRFVRERMQQCPVFANVVLREDEAETRIPAHGVLEHITHCAQEVAGAENDPVRLKGPADRAPELGKNDEAGDESEDTSEKDDDDAGTAKADVDPHLDVAEVSIAVDPIHHVRPVQLMQALTASRRISRHCRAMRPRSSVTGSRPGSWAATVFFNLSSTRAAGRPCRP